MKVGDWVKHHKKLIPGQIIQAGNESATGQVSSWTIRFIDGSVDWWYENSLILITDKNEIITAMLIQ